MADAIGIIALIGAIALVFLLDKIWERQERQADQEEAFYTIDEVMAAADAALVDMARKREEAVKRENL